MLFLTANVVIVVHVLPSVLSLFFYIRVYITILTRVATAAVVVEAAAENGVGRQPTHTRLSFFKNTHKSQKKTTKRGKRNRTLYAIR